jgi:hydrogenase/urease accessory protein HupE
MTTVSKIGLGFVITGLVVGLLTPALGLQHLTNVIWIGLAVLCFVSMFVISFRTRTRKPPKSH